MTNRFETNVFLLSLIMFSNLSFADISTGEFIKECQEKAVVMKQVNGKLEAVGEKIGGFCSGYITGFISASVGILCFEEDDPDFILSIIEKYIEKEKIEPSQFAGKTVYESLFRVYKCE